MILLISSTFPPEPVVSASLSFDLAIALSEVRKVKVLTPRPSRPIGFSFENSVENNNLYEQIILPSFISPKYGLLGRMLESYSFGKHSSRYICSKHLDITCIYLNAWPLLAQLLIVKAAKRYSIPTVIHIQDIYPESLTNKIPLLGNTLLKLLLPLDKLILRNSKRIVAISKNMATYLSMTRGIPHDKINVINNWQDEKHFMDSGMLIKDIKSNEYINNIYTFMYLGNIGPIAGIEFIISTFAKLMSYNIRLIIAGSGSRKKDCIKIVESSGCPNITFCDVPYGKVAEIQKKADVMLLPMKRGSDLSSIPSKLPAYMLSRKPIIACVDSESDTANAILKAKCGWIIPPENMNELIKITNYILSLSKEELEIKGLNGFNYAIENFSKRENLPKLVNFILETELLNPLSQKTD